MCVDENKTGDTTMKPIRILASSWLPVLGALALAACSGGGGDSGASTPGNNLSQPGAQASVSELANTFAATLTGAQEVPQRPSGATGSGTVVIDPATRQMSATLTTTAIAGTDAHIHQAQPGLNGPIIFPLTETARGSGIWTTRSTLSEAQFNAFRAGDFYFNVHSLNFTDGEIRGQILPQQPGTVITGVNNSVNVITSPGTGTTSTGTGLNPFVASTATFLAALRGSQEAPPTASIAQGSATMLINPANRQFTAAITTTGIAGDAAHIHEGPAGVNGPIIVPLAESVTGSGIWSVSAVLTEAQFNSLHAGNLYFNVHSRAFPAGEIRGQLLPQTISLETITGATGGANATGTTGTGTTGTGTTGTGATGTTTTGTGMTGTGTTGTTTTGTGTTGTGATGTGLTGTGTTGTGAATPAGSDRSVGLLF
jgi:hypothetical protein